MSIVDQEKDAQQQTAATSSSQPMAIEQEEQDQHSRRSYVEQSSFPSKLWRLLGDAERGGYSDVISWVEDGTAFQVHNDVKVVPIIKQHFHVSKYKSFLRQLQAYKFQRVEPKITGRGKWRHGMFRRDNLSLCMKIQREESASNKLRKERRERARRAQQQIEETATLVAIKAAAAASSSSSQGHPSNAQRENHAGAPAPNLPTKQNEEWYKNELVALEQKKHILFSTQRSSVLEEARLCAALNEAEEELSSLERRKLILQKHRQWTQGQMPTPQSVLMEARLCRDVELKKIELAMLQKQQQDREERRQQELQLSCGGGAAAPAGDANRTESELRSMLELQQSLLHQQRRTLELQTSLLKHRSSSEVASLLQQADSSTNPADAAASQSQSASQKPQQQQPQHQPSSLQIVSNALDVLNGGGGNAGAAVTQGPFHPDRGPTAQSQQQQQSREMSAVQSLLLGGDKMNNLVSSVNGNNGDGDKHNVLASLLKNLDKSSRPTMTTPTGPSSSSSLTTTENNLRLMIEELVRRENSVGTGAACGPPAPTSAILEHCDYRQHAAPAAYPIPSSSYAQEEKSMPMPSTGFLNGTLPNSSSSPPPEKQLLSAFTNSAEGITNEELLNAKLQQLLLEKMNATERATNEEETLLNAAVTSLLGQQGAVIGGGGAGTRTGGMAQAMAMLNAGGAASTINGPPGPGGAMGMMDILRASTPSTDDSIVAERAMEILQASAPGSDNSMIANRAMEILQGSATGSLSGLVSSSSLLDAMRMGGNAMSDVSNNTSSAATATPSGPLSADLLQQFAETAMLVQRAAQAG